MWKLYLSKSFNNCSFAYQNRPQNIAPTPMEYSNSHLNSKFEKKYGNEVLVGNWFEDRIACEVEHNRGCPTYQTEYINQFRTISDCDSEAKMAAARNQSRNKQVHVKLVNKSEFYRNMTRSSDLHYGIIPKQTCGPIQRTYSQRTGSFEPQPDYTKSYGNKSNFGLLNYKRKLLMDEQREGRMLSVCRADYICPPKSAYEKRKL